MEMRDREPEERRERGATPRAGRVMRPSRRRPSEELERCCVVPTIAIVRRGGVG